MRNNRVIPLNAEIYYDNHQSVVTTTSILKFLDDKREIDEDVCVCLPRLTL